MFSYGDIVTYGERKYQVVGRVPDPRYPVCEIRDILNPWNHTIRVPESSLKASENREIFQYNELISKYTYENPYKGGYLDPRYTPNKVIFNPPATIVFWEDGTKTVVKCKKGEIFSPDAGYSIALARKLYGNNFRKIFKQVDGAWQECINDAIEHFNDILDIKNGVPDPKFKMGDEVSYLHGKKVYSVTGIRRRTDADEWEYKIHSDTSNDHYMAESNLRKA